jgi:IS30 family transposase
MAKSEYYTFDLKWLVSTRKAKALMKKGIRPIKYNSIHNRPPKILLRNTPGNFEIDSVIGKTNDKMALLTLIDI